MTEYVAGFLISRSSHSVVLVEKQKPAWQRGKLNGVGGKIEPGETPAEAMRREFLEEAGYDSAEWEKFATLRGAGFVVHFFRLVVDGWLPDVRTMEAERIVIRSLSKLSTPDVIPNLTWLIPMALSLDHDRVEGFNVEQVA